MGIIIFCSFIYNRTSLAALVACLPDERLTVALIRFGIKCDGRSGLIIARDYGVVGTHKMRHVLLNISIYLNK